MDKPRPLDPYRKKRNPERTPEPFGGTQRGTGLAGPERGARGDRQGVRAPEWNRQDRIFVVQKHAARRLHYDLRLEMEGVLKSWALPKGPSIDPREKRLAVHVEDHPIEYAGFEGIIPPDNYGAGEVIVWDRGWYRPVRETDPLEQLARGKLEIELFGFKLRGRWTLVRMSGKEKEWLLLKKEEPGSSSDEEPTVRYPQSVLSGLDVEEIADLPARLAALRAEIETLHPSRREVSPRHQSFMLAELAKNPFSGKEWLFEVKYDGVRVMAQRHGDGVVLYGRSGRTMTERYPEVAKALRTLPSDEFLIDGEIVALDESGRPSFQRLQARMGLTNPRDIQRGVAVVPVIAIFFDCLALEGYDLRRLPLLDRGSLPPPLSSRSAGRPDPLSRRDFWKVVLPEKCAGVRSRWGPDRADLLQGGRTGDRLFHRQRSRNPPISDQSGDDPASYLGVAPRLPRSSGLADSRSRSERGSVRRRHESRPFAPPAPRGAEHSFLYQDFGGDGAPSHGPAGRPLLL